MFVVGVGGFLDVSVVSCVAPFLPLFLLPVDTIPSIFTVAFGHWILMFVSSSDLLEQFLVGATPRYLESFVTIGNWAHPGLLNMIDCIGQSTWPHGRHCSRNFGTSS